MEDPQREWPLSTSSQKTWGLRGLYWGSYLALFKIPVKPL